MKTRVIPFIVALLTLAEVNSQTLVPMLMKNGRYGFVTFGTKELAIQRQFDEARPFNNGRALVKIKEAWGVINQKGEIVLKPEYSELEEISGGYLKGKKINSESESDFSMYENGIVFIDKEYKETDFSFLTSFAGGYAIILKDRNAHIIDTSLVFYRNMGETSFSPDVNMMIYDAPFQDGFFLVQEPEDIENGGDRKYNFIDRTGKFLLEKGYDAAEPFKDGLAKVGRDAKFGFIDRFGDEVIPIIYDKVGDFHDGLAYVKKGSGFGYINTKGEPVIALQGDYTGFDFSEGFSFVINKSSQCYYIDKKGVNIFGKFFKTPYYSELNEGYYDFSEGAAIFPLAVNGRNNIGYINKNGIEIVKPLYSSGTRFIGGVAIVSMPDKNYNTFYGIIDKTGKSITPIKYEKVLYADCDINNHDQPSQINENRLASCLNEIGVPKDLYEKTYTSILKSKLILVELLGQRFYVDTNGFEYIE